MAVRVREVSLQVGAVDATDSPRDVPNAIKTKERAAATRAPAITGVQWTKCLRASIGTVVGDWIVYTAGFPLVQRKPRNDRMNKITTISPIR